MPLRERVTVLGGALAVAGFCAGVVGLFGAVWCSTGKASGAAWGAALGLTAVLCPLLLGIGVGVHQREPAARRVALWVVPSLVACGAGLAHARGASAAAVVGGVAGAPLAVWVLLVLVPASFQFQHRGHRRSDAALAGVVIGAFFSGCAGAVALASWLSREHGLPDTAAEAFVVLPLGGGLIAGWCLVRLERRARARRVALVPDATRTRIRELWRKHRDLHRVEVELDREGLQPPGGGPWPGLLLRATARSA